MGFIWVNVTGNGTAYVDNPSPFNLDPVTLYAYPATGETIEDITARDSHGYAIAFDKVTEQTITYHEEWGDVTISVEFSGTTPPGPGPTPGSVPPWLLFKIAELNKMR